MGRCVMGDKDFMKLLCDEPLLAAHEAAAALGYPMPPLAADDDGDADADRLTYSAEATASYH
jgi:hypothetical protein